MFSNTNKMTSEKFHKMLLSRSTRVCTTGRPEVKFSKRALIALRSRANITRYFFKLQSRSVALTFPTNNIIIMA